MLRLRLRRRARCAQGDFERRARARALRAVRGATCDRDERDAGPRRARRASAGWPATATSARAARRGCGRGSARLDAARPDAGPRARARLGALAALALATERRRARRAARDAGSTPTPPRWRSRDHADHRRVGVAVARRSLRAGAPRAPPSMLGAAPRCAAAATTRCNPDGAARRAAATRSATGVRRGLRARPRARPEAAVARLDPAITRPAGRRRVARAARTPPAARPSSASVQSRCSPTGPPSSSPRTASTRWVSGLTSANDCSQPGSVSVGTNVFDAEREREDEQEHDPLHRARRAGDHPDEHRDPAQAEREARRASTHAASTWATSVWPEADHVAEAEHDHASAARSARRRPARRRRAAPSARSAASGSGRRRPSRGRELRLTPIATPPSAIDWPRMPGSRNCR